MLSVSSVTSGDQIQDRLDQRASEIFIEEGSTIVMQGNKSLNVTKSVRIEGMGEGATIQIGDAGVLIWLSNQADIQVELVNLKLTVSAPLHNGYTDS